MGRLSLSTTASRWPAIAQQIVGLLASASTIGAAPDRTSTPAGDYGVFVGLYDPLTGARLTVARDGQSLGDRLLIGEVRVR